MTKTLIEIAQQLSTPQIAKNKVTKEIEAEKAVPKVQLIYGFNGVGKTRLSREFKDLVAAKIDAGDDVEITQPKMIYYNAFTEDLFYWDNDLTGDTERKLKIHPNAYTHWVLQDQGQESKVAYHFQRYATNKLTPRFNQEYKFKDPDGRNVTVPAFSEVTFSFEGGNEERSENVKISKAEESSFIWSIFYSLIAQVISCLNVDKVSDRETDRYNKLEYVFIDDPVCSLDENHLIEMAVDLGDLVKKSKSALKFIITTHSTFFYNILHNELNNKSCYLLESLEDGSFTLTQKQGDSNTSFSYHLRLKEILEQAIEKDQIQKYHFTLLRNLYEKTAQFLGYTQWSELLPEDRKLYHKRIIQYSSHSTLSMEEIAEPTPQEKLTVKFLLNHLCENFKFFKEIKQNG